MSEETIENTSMYTMVTLPVADSTYQTIRRFCEDYDIENVPTRKNMFFEVIARMGLHQPPQVENQITYYADDLHLEVVEATSEDGNVLIVSFHSPALEELYAASQKGVPAEEMYAEEPMMGIVISNRFDLENPDMDLLETKLRGYLDGKLTFGEMLTRYETEEAIFDYILDGREPEE